MITANFMGGYLWVLVKLRATNKTCCVCDAKLERCCDAFRPLTNTIDRALRMCYRCCADAKRRKGNRWGLNCVQVHIPEPRMMFVARTEEL